MYACVYASRDSGEGAQVCSACVASCAGRGRVHEPQRCNIGMSCRGAKEYVEGIWGVPQPLTPAVAPCYAPHVSTPAPPRHTRAAPLRTPAHALSRANATLVGSVCSHKGGMQQGEGLEAGDQLVLEA